MDFQAAFLAFFPLPLDISIKFSARFFTQRRRKNSRSIYCACDTRGTHYKYIATGIARYENFAKLCIYKYILKYFSTVHKVLSKIQGGFFTRRYMKKKKAASIDATSRRQLKFYRFRSEGIACRKYFDRLGPLATCAIHES